jgi:hypothetical protein
MKKLEKQADDMKKLEKQMADAGNKTMRKLVRLQLAGNILAGFDWNSSSNWALEKEILNNSFQLADELIKKAKL